MTVTVAPLSGGPDVICSSYGCAGIQRLREGVQVSFCRIASGREKGRFVVLATAGGPIEVERSGDGGGGWGG